MTEGNNTQDTTFEAAPTAQDILEIPREVLELNDKATQPAAQPEPQVAAPSQDEQLKAHSAREKEANLTYFRKLADQAARERDDAIRRLQEIERQKEQKVEYPDEDITIKDDELVEGKHLAKYVRKIKQLEEQQRNYIQRTTESTAEMRLKAQYPDFDKVMTMDNVQTLSAAYPELAKTINSSNDLYEKASSAYTLIKKFGIYNDQPFEADKQKAIANAAKPRPSASVSPQQGDSPMQRANAFANGLTKELKEQLIKEMNEARKGY
jgi:hypothetical protein